MERYKIAYDPKLKGPACVLLQAVWGGDRHMLHKYFDSDTWLVAPTPDMRMFAGTEEEIKKLASISKRQAR